MNKIHKEDTENLVSAIEKFTSTINSMNEKLDKHLEKGNKKEKEYDFRKKIKRK